MKPLAQNTMIQNRYLIVHLIGKGGMGEVYLAVDQRLGSAVALKRTFFAGDEMLGNAFEREARILARMRHPVLPKVSDHFGEGGEQFLVMEHISGDDLAKRLETSQKPFPASWVLFWADQLLDALSYLHSHEPPIIHRDIKPQNLKLTDENHIILLDFGLSKSSAAIPPESKAGGTGSTGNTGSVVGYTPHYAPMEQIRGIGTNQRSDLYSLSATLYQLMTNKIPADALSRADCLLNGMADPIQPLYELNPEISNGVSDVILKGMEVSQEKRYSNAREMQKILRKAFTEMQKATSAKPAVFNIQDVDVSGNDPQIMSPESNVGPGTSSPGTPMFDDIAPSYSSGANAAGSTGDDYDATIAFDPGMEAASLKQADVKTEVFLAGSVPFEIPEQKPAASFEPVAREENFVPEKDYSETNDFSSLSPDISPVGNSPDATVAYISIPDNVSNSGAGNQDFNSNPNTADSNDQFSQVSTPFPPPPQTNMAAQPVKHAPLKKKSSGKVFALLGGMAALFILTLAAAGGGWYYYANYYLPAAIVEETPTPEPSIEASATPEPTIENVANADNGNSNSENVFGSNSNSNDNDNSLTVEPTPEPTQKPTSVTPQGPVTGKTPVPRPTQQKPQATPAVKPKPKVQPTLLQ